jgi:1-acyl-sn-glycerol-3-phosphate acyltransferase
LVVANHASWRDIPVLAGCLDRPLRFLAFGPILNGRTFGPLIVSYFARYTSLPSWLTRFLAPRLARFLAPRLRAMGAIPVTRGHGLYRAVREALSEGGAVALFAQGGIQRGVPDGSFRPGVGWIACTLAASGLDLTVLPVALLGTDEARLRGRLEVRMGRPRKAPPGKGRGCYVQFSRRLEADVRRLAETDA